MIHAGFMYHSCVLMYHILLMLCKTYSLFLLSKYLDYNRLVCNLPKHPGVGAMNIRMSRAATSGCMKPEDGRVPVHFRLLFTFFLLVFCKNVPYVGVITSARRLRLHYHFDLVALS